MVVSGRADREIPGSFHLSQASGSLPFACVFYSAIWAPLFSPPGDSNSAFLLPCVVFYLPSPTFSELLAVQQSLKEEQSRPGRQ